MSNTRVTVAGDRLIVEPVGLDKVWSFTRRLEIPLGHVRGATHDPGMRTEPTGLRAPGLNIPGKRAGTFHHDGHRQFWNVSGFERAVVVALDPAERYERLVITVADPGAVVDAVNSAIATR